MGRFRREDAFKDGKPHLRKDGGKYITGQSRKCYFAWPELFINSYEVAHLFFGGLFLPQNIGGRKRKARPSDGAQSKTGQPQKRVQLSAARAVNTIQPPQPKALPYTIGLQPAYLSDSNNNHHYAQSGQAIMPSSILQTSQVHVQPHREATVHRAIQHSSRPTQQWTNFRTTSMPQISTTLTFSPEEMSLFGRVSSSAQKSNGLQPRLATNAAQQDVHNVDFAGNFQDNLYPMQNYQPPTAMGVGTNPFQMHIPLTQEHLDSVITSMDVASGERGRLDSQSYFGPFTHTAPRQMTTDVSGLSEDSPDYFTTWNPSVSGVLMASFIGRNGDQIPEPPHSPLLATQGRQQTSDASFENAQQEQSVRVNSRTRHPAPERVTTSEATSVTTTSKYPGAQNEDDLFVTAYGVPVVNYNHATAKPARQYGSNNLAPARRH